MVRLGRKTPTFTNVTYTTTKGQDAIDTYAESGQHLEEWQAIQINAIMATEPDGLWKYMKYGLCVSRRNGKGEILAAREMDGIINRKEKVCHTAHRTTTSHDAFNRLYNLLKNAGYEEHSKKKKDMPKKSFYASKQYGLEHIEVSGGGIIDFRTRTNNGGLGEGFDLLIIDEAQEYTGKQESALAYTVSASDNPQIILTGTPPTAVSGGEVFQNLHNDVHQSKAPAEVGWAEWSIDKQTSDVMNVDLWYEYNPSLGTILKERNVRAETPTGEVDFNIQRLGLWLSYSQKSEISAAEWDALKVDKVPLLDNRYYIGVKFGKDGANVAASIAMKTDDGRVFVEGLDCIPVRQGVGWVLEYLHNPKVESVAVDGASGQRILGDLMVGQGYKAPIFPKVADVISSSAMFEQAVVNKAIAHCGQPSLRNVVTNCERRAIGSNGGYGFRSLNDAYDIAIMDSAVLAYWLAATAPDVIPTQSIDY